MNTKELLQSIDEEIARLTKVRDLLSNKSKATSAANKRRPMSLAGRKRIAAAQRKRWAAAKKAA